jgi:hypothetical protein
LTSDSLRYSHRRNLSICESRDDDDDDDDDDDEALFAADAGGDDDEGGMLDVDVATCCWEEEVGGWDEAGGGGGVRPRWPLSLLDNDDDDDDAPSDVVDANEGESLVVDILCVLCVAWSYRIVLYLCAVIT